MGPPRSNDFFFGAADDTRTADDRPAGRLAGRPAERPAERPTERPAERIPGERVLLDYHL